MGFVAGFSEIKRGGSNVSGKNFSKIIRFVARLLKSKKMNQKKLRKTVKKSKENSQNNVLRVPTAYKIQILRNL